MFILEVAEFYPTRYQISQIDVFNEVIPCQSYKMSSSCHPYLMDFFEIFIGGRYHRDMKALKILASNSKHSRIYGIFLKNGKLVCLGCQFKCYFFLDDFVSNNLWSWKCTGVCFFTQETQKWHRICPKTYWFWAIGKSYQNLSFSIYL